VGVIAFRCMTGHLPFEGEAVGDVLVKLCTAPLPVPSHYVPDLPVGFDGWFVRALSREPEGRFQSATELGVSLATVCGVSVMTPAPGEVGGSSPNLRVRVSANTPYTPMPLGATTPSPVMRGPQITGAPLTQTPAPAVAKSSKGGLWLAGATVLVVLAIGVGVLSKVAGKGDEPAVREVGTGATKPEVIVTPKPVEPPPAELKKPDDPPPPAASSVPSEATAKPVTTQAVRPRPSRPPAKPKGQPPAKPGSKPPEDIGF
jgi:serine/threonine-protein kinase